MVAKELNGDFVPSWTRSDVAPVGIGSERFVVASILDGLLSKGLVISEDIDLFTEYSLL